MNKIYTVTAVGPVDKHRSRTWGWYEHFYDAVEATINNVTDMNEAGYYPYIVIEEVDEGILPITVPEKQTWYEFDKEDQKYHKCDMPEDFNHTFNWSFG